MPCCHTAQRSAATTCKTTGDMAALLDSMKRLKWVASAGCLFSLRRVHRVAGVCRWWGLPGHGACKQLAGRTAAQTSYAALQQHACSATTPCGPRQLTNDHAGSHQAQ